MRIHRHVFICASIPLQTMWSLATSKSAVIEHVAGCLECQRGLKCLHGGNKYKTCCRTCASLRKTVFRQLLLQLTVLMVKLVDVTLEPINKSLIKEPVMKDEPNGRLKARKIQAAQGSRRSSLEASRDEESDHESSDEENSEF